MAFKMKFSGFKQRDSKIDTSKYDNKKGYDTGNFEEEEKQQQLKNTILINNKEVNTDDDFKALFPYPVDLGGDLVSGLPTEDDHFAHIVGAQYRANKQKEKGNYRGAKMIMDAQKDNIRDYERKYKITLDPDYIKKLSDQYVESDTQYFKRK